MADPHASCAICNTRRPRRYCPGVYGHICPVCCGTERENTVNCPLDCPFLREARAREHPPEVHPRDLPHQDIRIDETFLDHNRSLVILLASGLAQAALAQDHAIDIDVREALASLTQQYVSLQSGLIYPTRPDNPIAARIQAGLEEHIREIEAALVERGAALRDADVLKILAFMARTEFRTNNGRRKGRAFIDFLREFLPPQTEGPQPMQSSLILS